MVKKIKLPFISWQMYDICISKKHFETYITENVYKVCTVYMRYETKRQKREGKEQKKQGHPPSFVMIMMQYLWNNFTVNMRSTVLLCYLRLRGDFPKSKTAQCEIFFRSLFTHKFRLLQFCSACHVCVDIIIQFLVGESSSSRANIEVNINYLISLPSASPICQTVVVFYLRTWWSISRQFVKVSLHNLCPKVKLNLI